jgi:hypothetical protein
MQPRPSDDTVSPGAPRVRVFMVNLLVEGGG